MTRVLVTGGSGFLGKHLVPRLEKVHGLQNVEWLDSKNFDLMDPDAVYAMFRTCKPEYLYHLAAVVGGIGANQKRPADFFHDNLLMGLNILKTASIPEYTPKKIIMVGTTCSYPYMPKTIPFVEEELFDGYPEPTNAPYGIAKRSLIAGSAAFAEQYGLNVVNVVLANLYGPGDNFDPHTSHVIPAILRRMYYASKLGSHNARLCGHDMPVALWGTGKPTRDFMHVDDAVEGLVRIMAQDHVPGIINLGTGIEHSIDYVADLISHYLGYKGIITWDARKPDGQPRRALNNTKLHQVTGWRPTVWLEEGIQRLVEWFKGNPQ